MLLSRHPGNHEYPLAEKPFPISLSNGPFQMPMAGNDIQTSKTASNRLSASGHLKELITTDSGWRATFQYKADSPVPQLQPWRVQNVLSKIHTFQAFHAHSHEFKHERCHSTSGDRRRPAQGYRMNAMPCHLFIFTRCSDLELSSQSTSGSLNRRQSRPRFAAGSPGRRAKESYRASRHGNTHR